MEKPGAVNDYRDLRVWTLGMDLVEIIYRVTQNFPKSEIYGLASQMRRAAVSVPSSIAEGHAREHTKEFLQHISMAQGSLAELQTQVEIARRLVYITDVESQQLNDLRTHLVKQLYSLRNALALKVAVKVRGK